jgi:hypothetical protein
MALAQAFIALGLTSMITWGVAIWRSGLLPKWVGLVFAVAYFGCIAITPVLTPVGGFLMIIAGGWIALHSVAKKRSALMIEPSACLV